MSSHACQLNHRIYLTLDSAEGTITGAALWCNITMPEAGSPNCQ